MRLPRLSLRKRPPALRKDQALRTYPVRNPAVREESVENGNVILVLPRQEKGLGGVLGKIFFVPPSRKLELDELGTFVWRRCNGRRRVKDLIDELGRKYKLNPREAEVSLLAYLRTLAKRRLVGFAVPSEERPAARGKEDPSR